MDSNQRLPRSISLTVDSYGTWCSWAILERLGSDTGGVRRRLLARGSADLPDGWTDRPVEHLLRAALDAAVGTGS